MDRFLFKLHDQKARLMAHLKGSSRSHTPPELSSSSLPNTSDLNNPAPNNSAFTLSKVSAGEIARITPINIPTVGTTVLTSTASMRSDVIPPAPIGSSGTHSNAIPALGSPSPHRTDAKIKIIVGLNALVNALAGVGGAFESLKSAVRAISECAELYDIEAANSKEYAMIAADLEERFKDLAGYFNSPTPPAMTSSIQNLAIGIIRETNNIKQKVHRSTLGRYTQATQDVSGILECYQRIHTIVGRLVQNANVNIWKIVDEEATERRLKDLGQSSAAWYRSAESSGRRNKCTKETRIELLSDMNDWAYDGREKVYWLNGMAGTGKTTIAYSLSDELHANRKLAASFFCSRQLPSCRDVKLILPTIAYQLARFSRPFRYALSRTLDQNPDVHTREISEQFEGLIAEPLREVQMSMPENLVVVVDGLDECENHGDIQTLLDVILSHTSSLAIKFFVSSRPEPAIISRIQIQRGEGALFQLRLHELEHTVVSQDIETYLKDQLSYMELVPADLQTLTSQCGVLFIYAATAVRYIKSDNPARSPDRLREVLEAPISMNDQEETIDSLYTAIMGAAFNNKKLREKDRREMSLVVRSVVCAQEPLTPAVIASLLNIRSESLVRAALAPFLSVLTISETSGVVNTLHASFLDYLFDEGRSGKFYCDSSKHNGILAQACFDVIKVPEPPFNICGLESSFLLDKDVPGLNERVDLAISSELFYACRHWGSHLELAQASEGLFGTLLEFLSERLLLWMEVMNLKKCIHEGAKAISQVYAWCQRIGSTKEIQDITSDASKFTTAFSLSPILQSTPHIYVSALAVWPRECPISKCYAQTVKNLTKLVGTAMTQSGSALRAILKGTDWITSAACSPDGAYIASGSRDRTVRVWDAHTGQTVGSPLEGHASAVSSLSYSPDGAYIVSGSDDTTIRIWDAHTGQMIGSPLEGHTGSIRSISYSPDGMHIVSSSEDRTIRIWDAYTGQTVGSPLEGHTSAVSSVSYSPDGAQIVSGCDGGTIRIWDARTSQITSSPVEGQIGPIYSVSYSPDGMSIVSGSYDRTIRIWDAHTGHMVGSPFEGHIGSIRSVSYSPDGTHIVSGSDDKTIRIWDTRTGQIVGNSLEGHTGSIRSVSYSPDGTHIVSSSHDSSIRIWVAPTGQMFGSPLEGHTGSIRSLSYSPDGSYIVSGSYDKTIRIWDAHTSQMLGSPLEGHTSVVNSVSYSPDGVHIVSGSDDRTIRIWDAHTGRTVGSPFEGHTDWIHSVSYSPDGTHIVSGSDDNTIRIWDSCTGQMAGSALEGHNGPIYSVLYSPDGAYIVSGSYDRTIRIWDAHTGQMVGNPLEGHTDWIHSVSYSSDGAYIVSGSDDRTIRIWDARTGQMIGIPLEGHTGSIRSVSYSPDGSYIVSGSFDRTVRIWDAHTGQMVGSPLEGHTSAVNSVSYSPDGAQIVSGSGDSTLRIWDSQDRQRSEVSPEVGYGSAQISSPNIEHPEPNPHSSNAEAPISYWTVNDYGWVVSSRSELLMWVPLDLRPVLWRPRNTAVISRRGWLGLDFSNASLGPAWHRCYQPENIASRRNSES